MGLRSAPITAAPEKTGDDLAGELASFQAYFADAVASRHEVVQRRLASLEEEHATLIRLKDEVRA